jgi:hypothetical protein
MTKNCSYPRNDEAREKQCQHDDGANLGRRLRLDIRGDKDGGGDAGDHEADVENESLHSISPRSVARTDSQANTRNWQGLATLLKSEER